MAKVFLTKVWGYNPSMWPILGFGTKAGVSKFEKEYAVGDFIALVGTKGEETEDQNKGRLLGLIQVTNVVVDLVAVLESIGTELQAHWYKDDGEFKWPKGFPYLSAKSFVDKPLLDDILPHRAGKNARAEAAYAIELPEEDADKILGLKTKEDIFPDSPILKSHKKLKDILTHTGPAPALGERVSNYEDHENYVYVFKLEKTDFYKIGRSNDIQRRLAEFNTSPHAIWSEKTFELVNSHCLQDANSAHEVEQMLHAKLNEFSKGYECYKIPKESIAITSLGSVVFEYSQKEDT